jgi:hypothetical protein
VDTNFNTIGTKKAETSQEPNSSPVWTAVFFLNLQCCGDERERDWVLDKMKNLFPHQNTESKKERKKMNEEHNTHSHDFAFPLKVLCSTVEQQQHESSTRQQTSEPNCINLKKFARTPHENPTVLISNTTYDIHQ